MSTLYLKRVTLKGLFFKTKGKGGMSPPQPLPFEVPEDAKLVSFDEDSGKLTWDSGSGVITSEDIEAAKDAILAPTPIDRIKTGIRPRRNKLLAESDCTQLADCPLSVDSRADWATFRQELRDLTDTITKDGQAVVWPTPPAK
jgi:hypothetical protein